MSKYFRLQLTIILIAFSLLIAVVIALLDYNKLENQIHDTHTMKIEVVENEVVNALHTIDKVYHFFDGEIAKEMEKNSDYLLHHYEENPDFESWDFTALQQTFGMDVYIINDKNVVTHSSYKKDIGLDFQECCRTFASLLDERRSGTKFTHDGMDIQQSDGQIKKFSYLPTPDHKYIIELSVSLKDDEIFKEFNFLNVINSLEENYEEIKSIHVYTPAGLILGYMDEEGRSKEIPEEMRKTFRHVLKTGKPNELFKRSDMQNLHYRYIPYEAQNTKGLSTTRIVEIVYDEAKLDSVLSYYRDKLVIQLVIIVIGSVILSFIIARLVARPIHLAFHDSLTGLKNRAAFEDEVKKKLSKNEESVALMMIDLDNFKAVNDSLGHAEGDRILKYTAKTIQDEVGSLNIASRVGGDEFVVVFSNITKEAIEQIAKSMVEKIKKEFTLFHEGKQIDVSVSVGIAFSIIGDKVDTFYDRADKALYTSKENGKNQFTIYKEN